ncbi:MAG: aromatic-ring-hydroxylating dioxygenase subunit beta [Pseudomonadales bacterium]
MTNKTNDRIESLLYLESRLMDENRYSEWLELFADECEYWIPSNAEDVDPRRHVSILFGGRPMLENHVQRLMEGKAFAQVPASRMRRLVSNIEIEKLEGDWAVSANFLIYEIRKHSQRLHGGRSEYRLLEVDNKLRISSKKVLLVGIDEHQENITFLL